MAAMATRRAPILPMLTSQTWAEFLKLWRVRAFMTEAEARAAYEASVAENVDSHSS